MAEFLNVGQGGVGGVCEIKWRIGAQEIQGSNLMVDGFNKILKIQTVFCDIFLGQSKPMELAIWMIKGLMSIWLSKE